MPRRRPIKPEQPRVEPEIIPPERSRTRAYQGGPEWFGGNERSTSRIFVARLGPSWGIIGIVLLIGLITGAVLAIVLGALLIAIPVIGLLVAGALIGWGLRPLDPSTNLASARAMPRGQIRRRGPRRSVRSLRNERAILPTLRRVSPLI
jgi:hypothetical protein